MDWSGYKRTVCRHKLPSVYQYRFIQNKSLKTTFSNLRSEEAEQRLSIESALRLQPNPSFCYKSRKQLLASVPKRDFGHSSQLSGREILSDTRVSTTE